MAKTLRPRRGVRPGHDAAYPSAEPGCLRMDANTNLLGSNPCVARALRSGAARDLNHYPSPHSDRLRAALARRHAARAEEVLVGNGSDELIDLAMKAYVNPGDRVAIPAPSFIMYRFYATVNLAAAVHVPLLRPAFALDVPAMLATRARIHFLASPNNPTGNRFDPRAIETLARRAEGLVVIDEAYADFCEQDYASRWRRFSNVVVFRTFSKSHGLAGLRVGYALGPAPIIRQMLAAKAPFTVGTLAERIALEALRAPGFVRRSRRIVARERSWLASHLARLGLRPAPSDANFILVDARRPAGPLVEALRRRKILVRDMSGFAGLDGFFRVTIGRREHNVRLIRALEAALP